MTGPDHLTGETHTLVGTSAIEDTGAWLATRAARAIFASTPGIMDFGWIIENHDGSILLAKRGDTLVYNGARVRRA